MPTNVPSVSPIGSLRCAECGKIVACSTTDVRCFIRAGWPKCCSEVMTYRAAPDKPKVPPDQIDA